MSFENWLKIIKTELYDGLFILNSYTKDQDTTSN